MSNFDKELVKKRFATHLKEYDELSVVQRDICLRLSKHLSRVGGTAKMQGAAYEVGAGTGFLTSHMLKHYPHLKWFINDLVPETKDFIDPIIASSVAEHTSYLWGDAETITPPERVSLVVSCSAMQWFNSLESYFSLLAPHINEGGIFAFSIFGEHNFHQVRNASGGVGLDYPSIEEVQLWGEENGMELLLSEDYQQTIWFTSPEEVLNYIKQSGMNGNGSRKWTKADFDIFCEKYNHYYREEQGVSLSFNPLIFIFQKK